MDTLTPKKRSWNMSRIRGKDTRPEKKIRSLLHAKGYRFKLSDKILPGRPDIVLPKYRAVIFVHGCLWHRHHDCKYAYTPKSRIEFWKEKFAKNVKRDKKNLSLLQRAGWLTIAVWECEIKKNTEDVLNRVSEILQQQLKMREVA